MATIDEELMQSLVNGLYVNHTLVKLAFTGHGSMDDGAISELSRFMRASDTSSTLRKLKISGYADSYANLFAGSEDGTDIVAAMLRDVSERQGVQHWIVHPNLDSWTAK
jgi:hypothetical protein